MESTSGVSKQLGAEIWQAEIPIRVVLKNVGVPDVPLPLYMKLPRFGYIPFLYRYVAQFFARSVVHKMKQIIVFEHDHVPLPWHIPAGVLYDVVGGNQVPWQLEVSFSDGQPSGMLPWDDPDNELAPLRRSFFHSLKESAYILNGPDGSHPVSMLDLETKRRLVESIKSNDCEQFGNTLSDLHLPEKNPKHQTVPVRIYLNKGNLRNWKDDLTFLSRPVRADLTLTDCLKEILPKINWSQTDLDIHRSTSLQDIGDDEANPFSVPPIVSICSIQPDFESSSIGGLHACLHGPDNFLYITIRPVP